MQFTIKSQKRCVYVMCIAFIFGGVYYHFPKIYFFIIWHEINILYDDP